MLIAFVIFVATYWLSTFEITFRRVKKSDLIRKKKFAKNLIIKNEKEKTLAFATENSFLPFKTDRT